jgi:hypothetical protein
MVLFPAWNLCSERQLFPQTYRRQPEFTHAWAGRKQGLRFIAGSFVFVAENFGGAPELSLCGSGTVTMRFVIGAAICLLALYAVDTYWFDGFYFDALHGMARQMRGVLLNLVCRREQGQR